MFAAAAGLSCNVVVASVRKGGCGDLQEGVIPASPSFVVLALKEY